MKIAALALALFSAFTVSSASATTLNVPGTYASVQACADAAQPGDICLVSAGTYGTVRVPRSGLPGSSITFRAEAGARPRVSGFDLQGRSRIVIDGFELNGSVTCASGCSFIQIVNNAFEGTGRAIQLHAEEVLISNNTFNNSSNDMVRQFGRRWTIRNNVVIDEADVGDMHMDFWQSWCDPNTSSGTAASHALIENNQFVNVAGGNVHFALINGTSNCAHPTTNLIFRHNTIRNIGSLAIYVDQNQAAPGGRDNAIYNNTFIDLSEGMLATWQDYCCPMSASGSSIGINNIFYNAADRSGAIGFSWGAGGSQSHNLYYHAGGNMTFAGLASSETGAVKNQNPLLVNPASHDYSLRSGSPGIDRGGPLTRVASADTGSGTTLILVDAEVFQPGWGGAMADTIAVGTVSNVARIAAIDYSTNTITLDTPLARADGAPVYLARDSDGTEVLRGAAPDIGAFESPSSTTRTAPAAPSNVRLIR